ncbi:MAG: hypothetical protein IPH86_17685 [bacterium]|nr:hypothetical protein [bacterium]
MPPCLTSAEAGWKTGVIVGAGKELENDALLGRGHPQVDDFVVTAAAVLTLPAGGGRGRPPFQLPF